MPSVSHKTHDVECFLVLGFLCWFGRKPFNLVLPFSLIGSDGATNPLGCCELPHLSALFPSQPAQIGLTGCKTWLTGRAWPLCWGEEQLGSQTQRAAVLRGPGVEGAMLPQPHRYPDLQVHEASLKTFLARQTPEIPLIRMNLDFLFCCPFQWFPQIFYFHCIFPVLQTFDTFDMQAGNNSSLP